MSKKNNSMRENDAENLAATKSKDAKEKKTEERLPGGKNPEKLSRAAIITIIVSIILAASILALSIVLAVMDIMKKNAPAFNYETDNLERYIELAESAYKGYNIELDIPEVNDMEIDLAVMKAWISATRETAQTKFDGSLRFDQPVAAGDQAYIYYRGYEIDEYGSQVDLANTSNFSSASPDKLVIGSGSFVPGFEIGLIGAMPNQPGTFEVIKSGNPLDGDIIYAEISYTEESGDYKQNELVRIDLNDPNLAKKWGINDYEEGEVMTIGDYLKKQSIGITELNAFELVKEETGEIITLTSVKIQYVTRCEKPGNYVTVETVFPYDYSSEALRNKTVYFDVYVEKVLCYDTPAFDESFIKDTLKLTPERLSEFSGDTLVEKYRSCIKSALEEERAEAKETAAKEEMWNRLKKNANVKSLPQSEIKRVYDDYFYQYELTMAQNSSYYDSIDSLICEDLGLGEGGNWQAALTEKVKGEITEKIIFYTIIRRENIAIPEDKYDEIYQQELESDFKYYKNKTRFDYESDEKYLAAVKEHEQTIIDAYGVEYYKEAVKYYYAEDVILSYANIVPPQPPQTA